MNKTIRAYVVGRPEPIIREFRTADPVRAAHLAAKAARQIDRDMSDDMLVRVSGGAEYAVEMPSGEVERIEVTGQPGPVLS